MVGELYLFYQLPSVLGYDLRVHLQSSRRRNLLLDLSAPLAGHCFHLSPGYFIPFGLFRVSQVGFRMLSLFFILIKQRWGMLVWIFDLVYAFSMRSQVFSFPEEIIGSHEALVLILIGLCPADVHIPAECACQFLLIEFVLGDKVVKSTVLGTSFLGLFLLGLLVFSQELVGVLLEGKCLAIRGGMGVWMRVIVDTAQYSFLVVLEPVEEGVVDFDESQHGRIQLFEGQLFLLSRLQAKKSVGSG